MTHSAAIAATAKYCRPHFQPMLLCKKGSDFKLTGRF